ncbi:MAG: hypothetical protein GKR89_37450 [Candidatus Latescibacteria bacterium]|nr:hypothetical protein [Candidatus Latescibacterota bacterium]
MAPKKRLGAAQPDTPSIDYRLADPAAVLQRVDANLATLEDLLERAGRAGCDIVALPEDTLGLLHWEAANKDRLEAVLRPAVERMLKCLGQTAAAHSMYLVCCSDAFHDDGQLYNTSFLLGREGQKLGHYRKVNMTLSEAGLRQRGDQFPVFATSDLGTLGLLICYDMVFPEPARCLALGGADIVFHSTLGGAAIGDGDISRAAFRTRAAENLVYLVVAWRGSGSMIIAPTGDILAAGGDGDLVIADIDPFGGRQGGDAFNTQEDMRARLFRERKPSAYSILTDPHPPVLDKVPESISVAEAARIADGVLTVGAERFREAEELAHQGQKAAATSAFQALRAEYPTSWIDRVAQERLAALETAL